MMAPAAAQSDEAEDLVARARAQSLWLDPGWLTLGHYHRAAGGGFRSQAAGPAFFLSPRGRDDPRAELEATLQAFLAPSASPDAAAQCRFPARRQWLAERLALDVSRLPARDCPRFDQWNEAIDAEAATLVFASAYLNNPGSMYGHTFLKLRRRGARAGEDLLDYTINFAGTPDTDNAFLYALRGIGGGFPGTFSTMPYYMKVQEYTNMESRDLWEYELALDSAQVAQLVRHAWEVGSTRFPYYFFSQNCSYQLLTLLDAADPRLRLLDEFGFGTVPVNTVRAVLARPGLVKGARYRPSFVTQLRARRARLTAEELALATRLGEAPSEETLGQVRAKPPQRQALILDSADDYLRLRAGFGNDLPAGAARRERALLVARGRLGLPPSAADPPRPAAPHQGEGSMRVGLGGGVSSVSAFEELQWRGAYHDLASPDDGYGADSQLEMGDLLLRLGNRRRRPYVERFDLVNIVSLAPWDRWLRKPSWKASTGIDQAKELGCEGPSCTYWNTNAGLGLSAAVSGRGSRVVGYVLADGDAGVSPAFDRGWRIGAGGTAGLIVEWTRCWRTQAEATGIIYQQGPAQRRLRVINTWQPSKDWEARVTLERRALLSEAGAALLFYF